MFSEHIKELRIQNQMPQRQLAAALDIDTATYCKIEKGERRAKREQVSILSKLFNVNTEQLLILWLADQVSAVVSSEQRIAPQALSLVMSYPHRYNRSYIRTYDYKTVFSVFAPITLLSLCSKTPLL